MFEISSSKGCGLMITYGYQCGDRSSCDCACKCKHRPNYRFHNCSVAIRRFFEYRLHIKLPQLIYFNKKWVKLSGTTKCPFNKPRRYTCHDCKFQNGYDEYYNGLCSNKDYIRLNKEGRSKEHDVKGQSYCKFFEKNEWADKYDKDTGETIWND